MSDSAKAPDQVPEKVCKLIERAHQEWMAALDVVNDPIFLHDSEFRILRCNKAYQQCAGLAFEQIIGQPYYEIFPRTHAPLRHCLQAMERTAGELEEELTVDRAIYRSRSFTIWDDEGVYLYSIHTLEDITGRKQDEKRLRDSEAFIKAVLDNLPVGIAVNSSAPPVVFNYMNDNFPGLYRTTRDKLTDPDSFWEAVYEDPGFRQQIRQRVLEDCASGDVGRMHWDDIPLVRSGEETAYISARDIPLPDKQLVISMVWDVTERKRAEQVLQDEKRFSDALVQKLPDIFFLLDPQGKLLRWNMNLQEASGLSAEEVAAANALDFVHEEDRPLIVQKIRQTLETGSASAEARLVLKNRDRDYVLTGTRIETQHGPNVIGLGVDISERKQHELAMKRANRALRTISAGNEALIHAIEEGALLQEMCDVAVQVGGYRMAWIGYSSDDAGKTIEQMAQAGFEEISPNLSPLQWNDALRESCPAGRAIISGKTEVVQDVLTDAEGSGWRESARRYGYASCIALPLMDGKRAFGALVLFDDKVRVFDADEIRLLEEMAGDLAFGILTLRVKAAHREHEQRLQKNMLQTVEAIASIVEMRDPYTSGHQARVAVLAQEIARQMGLPEEQMHAIHLAGLVHDLGKIQVPAEILSKPGRLTELEYSMIKMHPKAGYDILKGVDFSWPIAEMVWQHHERMDGSGYPRGLKGDEILPAARILSVADLVEAMSSHRPYRAGLGIDAALAEISRGRGTLFDAQVVDACVALFREHNYVLPN